MQRWHAMLYKLLTELCWRGEKDGCEALGTDFSLQSYYYTTSRSVIQVTIGGGILPGRPGTCK